MPKEQCLSPKSPQVRGGPRTCTCVSPSAMQAGPLRFSGPWEAGPVMALPRSGDREGQGKLETGGDIEKDSEDDVWFP